MGRKLWPGMNVDLELRSRDRPAMLTSAASPADTDSLAYS